MKQFIAWLLLSPVAMAETAENAAKNINTGNILQTLLGLILVLVLIGLMGWILKRSQNFTQSGQGPFRVISAVALGPREKAVLLQVGDQQLLIGVTAQQVNLLHSLPEALQFGDKRTGNTSNAFADKLKQMMQQQKKS